MSKVYMVQNPMRMIRDSKTNEIIGTQNVFDVRPAEQYGEIVTLIPDDFSRNGLIAINPLIAVLRRKLAAMTSEDYILPTGDPIAILICGALAIRMAKQYNGGLLKILKWQKRESKYDVIEINIGDV